MDCSRTESVNVFKVFDSSKRRRERRKRDGGDNNSVASDGSSGSSQRIRSNRASLQNLASRMNIEARSQSTEGKRDHDSSPSASRSPGERTRSSRRSRRPRREGISLALNSATVDTPRSESPLQETNASDRLPKEQDSIIYTYLEDTLKKDRRKHRQYEDVSKKSKEKRDPATERGLAIDRSREHARDLTRTRKSVCENELNRDHSSKHYSPCRQSPRRHSHRHRTPCKHRHRHRHDKNESDQTPKEGSPDKAKDSMALLETFAELCVQLNKKTTNQVANNPPLTCIQTHKSLQCEDLTRQEATNNLSMNLTKCCPSPENIVSSRVRSQDNFQERMQNYESTPRRNAQFDGQSVVELRNGRGPYDKECYKYGSKLDNVMSRAHNNIDGDLYRSYPADIAATASRVEYGYRPSRMSFNRDYDNQRDMSRRQFEEERRKQSMEQKTSRSFEVPRDGYDEEKMYRRTARSDNTKAYDMRNKRFDDRERRYNMALGNSNRERDRRSKQAFDKNSIASREDDFPFKDRMSERERGSGLSVADGENSTVSGKSNCLRVVKQEIAEQREAMDKMMLLWKELMRCFKTISPSQQDPAAEKKINENATNAQESAAAQLQLWRECMRRYETVARDVGDTDARLMEEINKQRSEMGEMATMWQECLQRYRDISNDFNNLKQKLAVPAESPSRMPVAHTAHGQPPVINSEGEGHAMPSASYRMPSSYPTMAPMQPPGYPNSGSPLRARASIPPAWWWGGERPPSPRRRHDSPEAHRQKERDRDRSRYKEKSSKPNGGRSEHRHRKR